MHWEDALASARSQPDVTFIEWCGMYVDNENPTPVQIRSACEVARPILIRNNVIDPNLAINQIIRKTDG